MLVPAIQVCSLPTVGRQGFFEKSHRIVVNIDPSAEQFAVIPALMKKHVWRAAIEVGFIIFLFYSNLLMGEFERSGSGRSKGLAWALADILTAPNLAIAAVAGVVGYVIFEFLRKRY